MTLFGTAGIRGPVGDTVTPRLALAVGQAVGAPGETVVVGRDGRETGTALAAAMEAGLASAGSHVRRVGMVPTPTLAFASRSRRGVMLTASHNPPSDNGIKLFVDGVEYDREAERTVEAAVEKRARGTLGRDAQGDTGEVANNRLAAWTEWGTAENLDVLEPYRDAVVEYVRERFESEKPLSGRSVAVDCGNGVGALATPQVLDRLGASVVGINATVDGHFPARESKPTPDSLTDFSRFLAEGTFDLGIAHDGDADRLVILGPDGEVIHEDTILAVVAAHYTRTADADDPVVVTTPNASARIDDRVRDAGGRVERVELGALHEGIARVREERDGETGGGGVDEDSTETAVVFAAEPWKHIHPAFGGWIDGVVSAAVVTALVAEAGSTDALREPVTERPYRKESIECPEERKAAVMNALETDLSRAFSNATVDTDYGIRLEFSDGAWVLVRPSGTEPYVRIYAESESVERLVADTREIVGAAIDAERQ